jgi:hypothetical protein
VREGCRSRRHFLHIGALNRATFPRSRDLEAD